MLDTATGEVVNETLAHEGEIVREFYSRLASAVRVGIEATGSMKWFLNLMEELGIDCQVGHPATIRDYRCKLTVNERGSVKYLFPKQAMQSFL
jgi:hypothetical protein